MKPIQTEEQIEANFLAKRAANRLAEEQINALEQQKLEANRVMALQAQNSKEREIRSLYAAYVAGMAGKYMQVMPIEEWYSQYKSLVINQSW